MFITPAYAQSPSGGSDFLVNMLPILLIIVIFYFLIIRPQQQRMKEHRSMVAAVRRGDIIVSAGGVVGKVTKVIDDNEVQVEIAEGVRVKLVRSTISEVRAKGEPVKESA